MYGERRAKNITDTETRILTGSRKKMSKRNVSSNKAGFEQKQNKYESKRKRQRHERSVLETWRRKGQEKQGENVKGLVRGLAEE